MRNLLLVAPDRRRMAIVRRYEGLIHPYLLVDLHTGATQDLGPQLASLDDYERNGWARYTWATSGWMSVATTRPSPAEATVAPSCAPA